MSEHDVGTTNRDHSGMSLLRIIAAFLVVFIHVSPEIFSVMSSSWFSVNVAASISRISVPLFFMISGYFAFSSKKITISSFLKKKFSRILIPLIAWSFVYICYNKTTIDASFIFGLFTSAPAHYHLWFFYTLIPMVLLTPLLLNFVNNTNANHVLYFLMLWLLLSLTPSLIQAIIYFTNFEDPILKVGKSQLFISMFGYYLIGGFIRNLNLSMKNTTLILTFALSSCITIALTYLLSKVLGKPSQGFFVYYSPFVAASSISVFIAFTKVTIKDEKLAKCIKLISTVTLGTYLVHPIIIDYLKPIILKSDTALSLIFMTFFIFLISAIITFFLSKIPLVKNIV